jgi:sarcosine oxidase subunit beta
MTATRPQTAIIGGGLMGCWTAFFLRRRGHRVTVIEKGNVGEQASGVNFGNLRIQGRHPSEFPLALRAQELWERFEELTGEDCEIASTGHLYLAHDAPQAQTLETYASEANAHGLKIELLAPPDIRKRWPWLGEDIVSASFSARDGSANPRLSTPAIARAAAGIGAEILERTRVLSIEKGPSGFTINTDCGITVESDHLVNAAGAWANDIAAMFGETAPMFAAGPPQFVTEALPLFVGHAVQSVDGRVMFRQVARGNVVVAGYPRGSSDPVLNRALVSPVKTLNTMRWLGEVVPALKGVHVIRVWSGIEGYIPDMLPVIGRSETTDNLIHAFGFCGHGFQLSPGVGLALSELIVDGVTPTPLDPYAISRFSDADWTGSAKHESEFDEAFTATAGQA